MSHMDGKMSANFWYQDDKVSHFQKIIRTFVFRGPIPGPQPDNISYLALEAYFR